MNYIAEIDDGASFAEYLVWKASQKKNSSSQNRKGGRANKKQACVPFSCEESAYRKVNA